MGGAQPKMLITMKGDEWLAKFPKGDYVDMPLVEYATNLLAQEAGIHIPDVHKIRIPVGHIVLMKRFDRQGDQRLHTLSARTLMENVYLHSYAGLVDVLRLHGDASTLREESREIFKRMVFNSLMDNVDDHNKNHAFILGPKGFYHLSPAYDLVPQMNGYDGLALPIAPGVADETHAAFLQHAPRFYLSSTEAQTAFDEVASTVDHWKETFATAGVTDGDINELKDYIDTDTKLDMRRCQTSSSNQKP